MSSRRSAQQWEQLFSAFQHSELSVTAFCQQHNLSASNFYAWRKRLASSSQYAKKPESLSSLIDFSGLLEAPNEPISRSWKITLRLGNGVELNLEQM